MTKAVSEKNKILYLHRNSERYAEMVIVAQQVRALDCGSRGRGFEPHLSPFDKPVV